MRLKTRTTAVFTVVLSIAGVGVLSALLVAQNESDRSLCHCDSAASCEAEGGPLAKGMSQQR